MYHDDYLATVEVDSNQKRATFEPNWQFGVGNEVPSL
jgi:hypothetical protein